MQDPPLWQRLLALLPYSLTWSAALPFGRDLFGSFPPLNALMLDILLVVIGLVFQLLQSLLGGGLLFRTLANTVFLGTLLILLFTVVQVLRGKEADLPTLSEAVRMQL